MFFAEKIAHYSILIFKINTYFPLFQIPAPLPFDV